MKKTVKISGILSCLLVGALFVITPKKDVSDLVLENVEALAHDEIKDESSVHCYGDGEVDCYGIKVEMKITGLSLD